VVVDPSNRLVTPLPDMALTGDAGEIISEDDAEDDYDLEGEEGFENEEEDGEEELYSDDDEEEEEDMNDDEEEEEDEIASDDEGEEMNDNQEDEEASEGEDVDLENLKVVDLKEILRAEGLPVSGKKSELIERIRANKS
jgi:SAP domain